LRGSELLMGNILDCGNSETRKGGGDSSTAKPIQSETDQRTAQLHSSTNGDVPVDVLNTTKDMWRWSVGYKIKQYSSNEEWEIELADSGTILIVPTRHVHEPFENFAHTSFDVLNPKFGQLMTDFNPNATSPLHMVVDILDIYTDTHHRVAQKWRKAEIVKHNRYCTWIKVHYLGWSSRYDQKINLLRDFDTRVKRYGSMTDSSSKNINITTGSIDIVNPELVFKQQLKNNSRGPMRVYLCKGDGNCLFRALAHQIWADQERHVQMRSMCCDYMVHHDIGRAMFANDEGYQKYIRKQRHLGVWGDDPEIRACEEMLDVRIEVWNSSLKTSGGLEPSTIHLSGSLPPSAELEKACVVRISLHGNNHYNSIILDSNEPPLMEDFPNSLHKQTIRLWRQQDQNRTSESLTNEQETEDEDSERDSD
jgi:hypothetical protein